MDAISVLGLGRVFTVNMTGNIVFLGFAAAGVPGFSVARALVSLAGFVVGTILGGRLGIAMVGVTRRRWLLCVAVVNDAVRRHALLRKSTVAAYGASVDSHVATDRHRTMTPQSTKGHCQ